MIDNCLEVSLAGKLYNMGMSHLVFDMDWLAGCYVVWLLTEFLSSWQNPRERSLLFSIHLIKYQLNFTTVPVYLLQVLAHYLHSEVFTTFVKDSEIFTNFYNFCVNFVVLTRG